MHTRGRCTNWRIYASYRQRISPELGELFVWLQHHQLGAKHHPGLLLLVVVDLDGGVVGHSEGDDLGLVSLHAGAGPGWGREGEGERVSDRYSDIQLPSVVLIN